MELAMNRKVMLTLAGAAAAVFMAWGSSQASPAFSSGAQHAGWLDRRWSKCIAAPTAIAIGAAIGLVGACAAIAGVTAASSCDLR